jgi:hypothetical protein
VSRTVSILRFSRPALLHGDSLAMEDAVINPRMWGRN